MFDDYTDLELLVGGVYRYYISLLHFQTSLQVINDCCTPVRYRFSIAYQTIETTAAATQHR